MQLQGGLHLKAKLVIIYVVSYTSAQFQIEQKRRSNCHLSRK